MIRRRWLRWVLVACLAPIVLVLLVLLSSPLWINQDFVKSEVTKIVAGATGGKAQFERIDLRLFPFPGVALSKVRFILPGVVEVDTQAVAVDIRLLPLMFGNVYPHRVEVISPQVRVYLAEPKPETPPQPEPPAKPLSLQDIEAAVRNVVQQIETAAPGLAAKVAAGRVELHIGQRPPIMLERLDVQLDVTKSAVVAKISSGGNLFGQLTAEARLASGNLDGDGHVELSRMQVAALGPVLGLADGWPVEEATVNVKLKLRMHGLSDTQVEAAIDADKVALRLGKGHLELIAPALDVAAQTKGKNFEAVVRRLAVDSPRVAATARFTHSDSGFALEAETADVDLPTVLAVAKGAAPDVDWLANFPVSFQRGTATTLKFGTQAASFDDLFDLPALRINGTLENVDLTVLVFYNLQVHQISTVASLENGVVHAQQVQARLDKTVGHDGTFEMDVKPDVPTLHAELVATVDLPEALAVARRVVPDKQAQQQFARIKQLTGTAVTRAVIGGDVNNVVPRVDVTALNASARYDLVPFPIRVTRGGVTYTNEAVSVQELEGTIGQSSFTRVSTRIGLHGPPRLSAHQGSVSLALGELFRWAGAQPNLAKQLEGVKDVSGALNVSINQLDLPLDALDRMRFRASARPDKVSIDAPRYGPRVQLNGGAIDVSEQIISVGGVNATALDAALALGGHTENYRNGIRAVQASAAGTVGPQTLKWIYSRARLPRELRPRDALTVSEANVDWRGSAGVVANGKVNVVGGPAIGFAVRSAGKRVEVQQVTVRDDASDLRFSGSFEGSHFSAAYKGKLAGSSIDRTFARPLASIGFLQGDFQADGDLNRPDATTATGVLQGSNIRLPPVLPFPLTIEQLSLAAKDKVLQVKSATLSSGDTRVEVSGTVTYLKDKFDINADVKSDKIVIPESKASKDAAAVNKGSDDSASLVGNEEGQHKLFEPLWKVPLSGIVRVDIGKLDSADIEIAPLVGSAALQTGRLHLVLQRAALCSINASGGVVVTPDDAEGELKLSARAAELNKSIACLTDQRLQITGKLDVDGSFSARGKLGTLLQNMQGTFSGTAKDGHINKFDSLAAVLKVVNVTQVIAGEMPDLNKGGMDYKSAHVEGRIEGHQIFFHAASLDASAMTVAAHGTANYQTKSINMTVLVAPFKTVTWVIQHIPILRGILGGMLIAVPVQVRGTLEKPVVVPLGPTAVGSRALEILTNTLKLPGQAINLVTPTTNGAQQPVTQPSATQQPATQQPTTQQPGTQPPAAKQPATPPPNTR